jgi:hypothetical protein
MDQAHHHLASAGTICKDDPEGAYGLAYAAARKALTALLASQGLRPTRAGGHIAPYEAALAQLDPPLGPMIRPFDRMRRQRADAEYPLIDTPGVTSEDVREDIVKITTIVDAVARVLDQMSPF